LIQAYQAGGLSLPDDFEISSLDDAVQQVLGVSDAVAAEAVATGPLTVRHITQAYRDHAKTRYVKNPQEIRRYSRLCDQLDEQFGDTLADQFGPLKLRKFRDYLVKTGIARKYVNRLVNCAVAIFAHAVSVEMLAMERVAALKTIESLHYGQTVAPETVPVVPVDIEVVRKTAKHLPPPVKAMLRIQLVTGMRPKEICTMRPCDIDRTDSEVWVYIPASHKTRWRGKAKRIPLVGDAKQAVTDYLNRDEKAFLFSPKESMAWRRAVGTAKRTTPPSCGNRVGSNRKLRPKSEPKDYYTTNAYRQAIVRAARAAKVPEWHPYQCRHLTASAIRAALGGVEEGRALLGHSTALQTEHYAMDDLAKAVKASQVAPRL
jgi:integrase